MKRRAALAGLLVAGLGPAPPSLRDAAAGRFRVGTAVVANTLPRSPTADLVAAHFDAVTPEYQAEPDHLEPLHGQFDFGPVDRIADVAAAHGMRTVGHTLFWYQMTPAWMWAGPDGKPLPRDQALANLRRHATGATARSKGRVQEWVVVNEALDEWANEGPLRDLPARRAIGDD